MDAFAKIINRQVAWAERQGLRPDANAYLSSVAENLFAPMSKLAEADYRGGAGNELDDRLGEAAKMRALYSSSALVCNVFDTWRSADADAGAIGRALAISSALASVRFEAQLPSGLRGTPPTLDLLLVASDSLAWGVESKFTEPFQGRQAHAPFVETYFKNDIGLWAALGLPKCQDLADRINWGVIKFVHLDAAQLLKHALGLRRKYEDGQLVLLWFNVEAPIAESLATEIREFSRSVDSTLGFRAVTYQDVFARLSQESTANPAHVNYLHSRYFAA